MAEDRKQPNVVIEPPTYPDLPDIPLDEMRRHASLLIAGEKSGTIEMMIKGARDVEAYLKGDAPAAKLKVIDK